jgi:hypothetical protein
MIWEQRGRNFYARIDNKGYMLIPPRGRGGHWTLYRRWSLVDRWEVVGEYYTEDEAKEVAK